MQHLFWVIPSKLAGRPGPIMAPWKLEHFQQAGITTIVSADERCEASKIKAAGLRHVEAFLPAYFPSTPAQIAEFVRGTEAGARHVLESISKGETVLLHCYAGQDRTGLISCAVLMELEGKTAREALAIFRKVQPHGLRSPGIEEVLWEYELLRG